MGNSIAWKKVHVLVIDDSREARRSICSMLHEIGIAHVLEAENWGDALKIKHATPGAVDVVICDWKMSGIDGIETLRQIRADSLDQPFLMVTEHRDAKSVMEAKEAGVTGYVLKPLSLSALQKGLVGVLARKYSDT